MRNISLGYYQVLGWFLFLSRRCRILLLCFYFVPFSKLFTPCLSQIFFDVSKWTSAFNLLTSLLSSVFSRQVNFFVSFKAKKIWGPLTNYRLSSIMKNLGSMINLSSQKPIFFMGVGVLNCLESFLQITKDCYRHITSITYFFYCNF